MKFSKGSRHPLKKRIAGTKKLKRILIVCEGAQTERNYFESFRVHRLDIQVIGEGANTVRLVRKAISYKEDAERAKDPFAHTWVVFDRDSFPRKNVEAAFQLAHRNGIQCAFSNEAFEIWYLLHFGYRDTGMSRVEYGKVLTHNLGFEYTKNSLKIFDALVAKMDVAIKNSKRLSLKYSSADKYSDRNPFTTVYELELLLKHSS